MSFSWFAKVVVDSACVHYGPADCCQGDRFRDREIKKIRWKMMRLQLMQKRKTYLLNAFDLKIWRSGFYHVIFLVLSTCHLRMLNKYFFTAMGNIDFELLKLRMLHFHFWSFGFLEIVFGNYICNVLTDIWCISVTRKRKDMSFVSEHFGV